MTELYWAAGFYDGEGSTTCRSSGRPRVDGTQYHTIRFYVKQTCREPLERFRKAVGCGYVRGPFESSGLGKKPFWFWEACSIESTQRMFKLFDPLLCSEKRQQMRNAVNKFMENCPNGSHVWEV